MHSAAAEQADSCENQNELARTATTPHHYCPGDIIVAPFLATALERSARSDPRTNAKFLPYVSFKIQACIRLYIILQKHKGCLKAVAIESSGGHGPNNLRLQNGNITRIVPNGYNGRYPVAPYVSAKIHDRDYSINDGRSVDLAQDRPINHEENIKIISRVHPMDFDRLLTRWHLLTEDPMMRRQFIDLSAEHAALQERYNSLLAQQGGMVNDRQFSHFRNP